VQGAIVVIRRFLAVCVAAFLVVGFGWQAVAFAGGNDSQHHYGPHAASITTSSGTSSPGGTISVFGKFFDPSEGITITLNGGTVGSGSTNSHGSFDISITIPSTTKQGFYTITATGSDGDSASTSIYVKVVHGYPTRHHHHGNGNGGNGNGGNGNGGNGNGNGGKGNGGNGNGNGGKGNGNDGNKDHGSKHGSHN
jgi:hypothetical protein